MDYREIHGWLGRRVQHIWIDQHRSDIEKGRMRNTAEALSTIHDWVLHGEGPLRTLTISVCGSQSHFNDLVHDFFFDRSRFDEVAKMLYNSWHGKQGDWGGVRRKIEAWAGNWSVMDGAEYDPNIVLAALHEYFGGDLWVNERLCYRDGKEILRVFELGESEKSVWQTEGQVGWWCMLNG